MNLKKINSNLQNALIEIGLTEANELQQDTYSLIKSGTEAIIQAPQGSGKTTTIALHCVQKLEKAVLQSPRALIVVENKEKALELQDLLKKMTKYTDLRIFMTHDKTNLDEDKNLISVGIDVLIITPNRLAEMFSGAGFDINQMKLIIIDDADLIFKVRLESKIKRITDSINKAQKILFCSEITERVESFAYQVFEEPLFLEMEEE